MTDSTPKDEHSIVLLIKMMKMTAAEDNVALVAIRKANAVLAKEGWDWEKLLKGKVTIIGDPFANLSTRATAAAMKPSAPPPPKAAPRYRCPVCATDVARPGTCLRCQAQSMRRTQPQPTPKPQPTRSIYHCVDCGTATVYASGAQCSACLAKAQNYASKANQTAKQRRKNPMTLDDIL